MSKELHNKMDQKEKWVNDVLESIEGLERAKPSDALFAKINSRLPNKTQVKIVPLKKLYWIAVAACAILVINIFVFSSEIKESTNEMKNNTDQAQLFNDFNIYD